MRTRIRYPFLRLRCGCYAAAQDGWTPLHSRVMYGYVEAAEALIRAGADVSAQYSVREPACRRVSRGSLVGKLTRYDVCFGERCWPRSSWLWAVHLAVMGYDLWA